MRAIVSFIATMGVGDGRHLGQGHAAQSLLTNIGDIARNLFWAEPGITRLHLISFNMNVDEEVLPHETLADSDGILKIAAFPTHKGHQDILPQRRFTILG